MNLHYSYCSLRDKIWVELIKRFHCPIRDKIWVERQMHHFLRAVGTPYKMSDILRTYGTHYVMYLIFYPHKIPNGIILNNFNQFKNEYELYR